MGIGGHGFGALPDKRVYGDTYSVHAHAIDDVVVGIFTYWLLRGNWPAPPASHRSIVGLQADVTRSASAGYWFSPSPRTRRDWSINRESGQTRPWTTTLLSIDARTLYTLHMCRHIRYMRGRYTCECERVRVSVCVRARALRWFQFNHPPVLHRCRDAAREVCRRQEEPPGVLRGRAKAYPKRAEGILAPGWWSNH